MVAELKRKQGPVLRNNPEKCFRTINLIFAPFLSYE